MDGWGWYGCLGRFRKKQIDAIMCIVDLMKRDSEIKILIGCTEDCDFYADIRGERLHSSHSA